MANIDADIFAAIMCEQCPDLELCAALAADPSKLAVQSTGAGWLLLFCFGLLARGAGQIDNISLITYRAGCYLFLVV
jgi:hypothetical protein